MAVRHLPCLADHVAVLAVFSGSIAAPPTPPPPGVLLETQHLPPPRGRVLAALHRHVDLVGSRPPSGRLPRHMMGEHGQARLPLHRLQQTGSSPLPGAGLVQATRPLKSSPGRRLASSPASPPWRDIHGRLQPCRPGCLGPLRSGTGDGSNLSILGRGLLQLVSARTPPPPRQGPGPY